MEAVEERRTFEKVMRNLERVGTILRAAFEEFGGVDANSLSTAKEIVGNLDKIEDKEGYLDSFINDWLELPDFRPILEKWIKRACSLYEYNCMDKCVKFEPEQLGEDYEEITDIYEQWRNSIIYWLCKHLRKGEMVDLKDGTIYLKKQEKKKKGDGIGKGVREVSFEDNLLVDDKGELLALLHKLIDGRKGKFVAIVIKVCCDCGIMVKPTYTQVKKEFGDIGDKSGYNAYMNDGKVKEDEKKPVYVALSKFLM